MGDLSYREDATRADHFRVSRPVLDERMASLWEQFTKTNDQQPMEFTGFEDLPGLMMRRSSQVTTQVDRLKAEGF